MFKTVEMDTLLNMFRYVNLIIIQEILNKFQCNSVKELLNKILQQLPDHSVYVEKKRKEFIYKWLINKYNISIHCRGGYVIPHEAKPIIERKDKDE